MATKETVRVNHDGTLVVPPFECAWLTGEGYEFRNGSGCVHFEAKGDTDVTIILKPTPGAKRLQPLASAGSQARAPAQAQAEGTVLQTPSTSSGLVGVVEANYTVILGSHRNSCLKVERNGSTVSQVQGLPGSRVSSRGFQPFWIDYHAGLITIGTGEHCLEQISWQWADNDPIPEITHVGLSCWDRHVSYRNIQVLASHKFKVQPCGQASSLHPAKSHETPSLGPPSLLSICIAVLNECLGTPHAPACRVAQAAELLLPSSRTLYRSCLDYLAHNLRQISTGLGVSPASAPGGPTTSPQTPPRPIAPHHDSLHLPHHVHGTHSADAATLQQGAAGPLDTSKPPTSSCSPPTSQVASAFQPASIQSSEALDSSINRSISSYPNSLADLQRPESAALDRDTVLDGFEQLPASFLCDLLQHNSIAVSEKEIFDVVVCWAQPGTSCQQQPFSGHHHVTTTVSVSQDPFTHPDSTDSANGSGLAQHQGQQGGHVAHMMQPELASLASHTSSPGAPAHHTPHNHLAPAADSEPALAGEQLGGGAHHHAACVDHRCAAEVLRVLSYIRYPLMTYQELASVQAHPLVAAQPALLSLITEALGGDTPGDQQHHQHQPAMSPGTSWLHSLPPGARIPGSTRLLRAGSFDSQRASSNRFQRRQQPASYECAYVCDGDRNGVLHFIGTMYGTQEWVNPVLSRRVDVRASSPAGRHTDPKALAGDKFLRTNFAGPRYVNGAPDSWWQVDLGQAHTLIPTYYTMRTDGSSDYVRSWVLQGSSDLVTWTDLQHHVSDPAFKRPGQYMSWPVRGPAAQTAYRAYRLLLTGPTTSQHQPYNFPLAHLELYGYLHRTQLEAGSGGPAAGGGGGGGGV